MLTLQRELYSVAVWIVNVTHGRRKEPVHCPMQVKLAHSRNARLCVGAGGILARSSNENHAITHRKFPVDTIS